MAPMQPWFAFIQMWEDLGRSSSRDIVKRMRCGNEEFQALHGIRLRHG